MEPLKDNPDRYSELMKHYNPNYDVMLPAFVHALMMLLDESDGSIHIRGWSSSSDLKNSYFVVNEKRYDFTAAWPCDFSMTTIEAFVGQAWKCIHDIRRKKAKEKANDSSAE